VRAGADFFFDKSDEFEQLPKAVLQIMKHGPINDARTTMQRYASDTSDAEEQ
jgi:hypothetical protein